MVERSFSTVQMAELLGTNQATIMDWIEKGWMPCKRLPGGDLRISETGLLQFLKVQGIDISTIMEKIARSEGKENEHALTKQGPVAPVADSPQAGRTDDVSAEATRRPDLQPPPAVKQEQTGPGGDEEEKPSSSGGPASGANATAQVAEAILQDAIANRASHVHLDPCKDGLALRMRIDGVIHDKPRFKQRLPDGLGPRIIEHFKALAGMDLGESSQVQAGTFHAKIDARDVEFALTCCPTRFGEKLVFHALQAGRVCRGLRELGLDAGNEELLGRLLQQPSGIILVAGPRRADRLNMLQAMLAEAADAGRDCLAPAGPDAVEVEGANSCCLADDARFASAESLRILCRQDPDVIMAADLADAVAARAAIDAAADGRLVLVSVPADGATVAIEMMLSSAQRWPLAATLLCVVERQTVRRVCPSCKQRVSPDGELVSRLGLQADEVGPDTYRGTGCDDCAQTGYVGMTALAAVLHVDETIAAMLRNGADARQIEQAAVRAGMKTLRQEQADKLREGLTSLEELCRVVRRGG